MTQQIAVRLPEELVNFVDSEVQAGNGSSRAAIVSKALERERRRAIAARDAEILAAGEPYPDLAGLAEFASNVPVDD